MEWRLFEEGTTPEWTTASWYEGREVAPHLEQEMHRPRLDLAAAMVREVVDAAPGYQMSLLDLGAGDGGFLSLLADIGEDRLAPMGIDITPSNVLGAMERGVRVDLGDLLDPSYPGEDCDIVVTTEVLEHLLDPHALLRHIAAHDVPYLIASSPWNEREGAAYGYHTWAWDHEGYEALLRQAGYVTMRHETTGMFQVIMGRLGA